MDYKLFWIKKENNTTEGPLMFHAIEQMYLEKRISPTCLIREEGTEKWLQFIQVQMLNKAKKKACLLAAASTSTNSGFFPLPAGLFIIIVSSILAILTLVNGICNFFELIKHRQEELALLSLLNTFTYFILLIFVAYTVDKLNACISYLKNMTK